MPLNPYIARPRADLERMTVAAALAGGPGSRHERRASMVLDQLDDEHIRDVGLRSVLRVCRQLASEGDPWTPAHVTKAHNPDDGKLTGGTFESLGELSMEAPSLERVCLALEALGDEHAASEAQETLGMALAALQARQGDPGAVDLALTLAQEAIARANGTLRNRGIESVARIFESMREEFARRGLEQALTSPWFTWDQYVRLERSQLHVVAARPGVGKTGMGCQLARHVATVPQDALGGSVGRVLFISSEMSRTALLSRMLAQEARMDLRKAMALAMSGENVSDDADKVRAAVERLMPAPIEIEDEPRPTLQRVRGVIMAAKSLPGPPLALVIVDYLQNIAPDSGVGALDNQAEGYKAIAYELHGMAREAEIPIVALAQLNRQAAGARPELHHLLGSSGIEAAADTVTLLHRGEREEPSDSDEWKSSGRMILDEAWIIAKNRHGKSGDIQMPFVGSMAGWSLPAMAQFDVGVLRGEES